MMSAIDSMAKAHILLSLPIGFPVTIYWSLLVPNSMQSIFVGPIYLIHIPIFFDIFCMSETGTKTQAP